MASGDPDTQFYARADNLREWLAEAVPAHGEAPSYHEWDARRDYDTGWQKKLFEAGYAGINWPAEYGGMGLDFLPHAHMSEILGRSPLGHYVFGCQAPDAGNIEITVDGLFELRLSYGAHPNRATNAPFTIYDGPTSEGMVRIDQRQAPSADRQWLDTTRVREEWPSRAPPGDPQESRGDLGQ